MRESPAWTIVAFARRADQEGGDRAVRLLLGGDRRQLDHQVRFQHDLLERLGRVVAVRRIALEQLLRGEDHLVGGLAPAALAAHAVGEHAHARSPGRAHGRGSGPGPAGRRDRPGGCRSSRTAGNRGSKCSWAKTIIGLILPKGPKPRTSRASEPSMDDNLHSLPRQLIELRIEHADLDNLIDRALLDATTRRPHAAPAEEAPPAAARPDRPSRSRARPPGRHERRRPPSGSPCVEAESAARAAPSTRRSRAGRRARGGRSRTTPSARCSCDMALAVAQRDRGAQRAGRRGRHRRRQDLRLSRADAAAAARAPCSARPPRRSRTSSSCATCRACATRSQLPVTRRPAQGPRELPVPAPPRPRAPGRAAARPLGRARAGQGRGVGADDRERRPGRARRPRRAQQHRSRWSPRRARTASAASARSIAAAT